jgi:hypothetical protein
MRAKVILPVSVLALVVVASAVYFHFKPDQPAPAVAETAASGDSASAAPSALPAILKKVSGPAQAHDGLPVQQDDADDLNSADHDEYVQERDAQIHQMGMSHNPAALPTILAELHNTDPAIRATALTATMDFGSKDAIPALKNEMTWAEDPREKVEIQRAINFLQVPPFALDENGAFAPDPSDQPAPSR